jgi:hypothetical protein
MSRAAGQPDLLDWQPPQPVARFPEAQVRAASLAGRISRAVAAALHSAEAEREAIAARMSAFLGERVSPSMLDAYASQAREDHRISVPRFAALLHATGDRRLLELLAEPMGWAVIERRHLPLIEVAAIRDREDELRRHREHLTRMARNGGAL